MNAPMNANASAATKVLPIANNPIKNTGMLSSRADVKGNTAAGRQPPRRRRNQNRDGAYASEKSSAAMMSDVTVAPLMSAALRFTPSTTVKVSRMIANASNHEPNEMEMSFICNYKGTV